MHIYGIYTFKQTKNVYGPIRWRKNAFCFVVDFFFFFLLIFLLCSVFFVRQKSNFHFFPFYCKEAKFYNKTRYIQITIQTYNKFRVNVILSLSNQMETVRDHAVCYCCWTRVQTHTQTHTHGDQHKESRQ